MNTLKHLIAVIGLSLLLAVTPARAGVDTTFTSSFNTFFATNTALFDEYPNLIAATPNATYLITQGVWSYSPDPVHGGQVFKWTTNGWQTVSNGYFVGWPNRAAWVDNSLWLCGYLTSTYTNEASGIARYFPSTGQWHATSRGLFVAGTATSVAMGRYVYYPTSTSYYYVGGQFAKAGSTNISRCTYNGSTYSWSSAGISLPMPTNGQADMIPVRDITVKQQDWPGSGGYYSGYELSVVGNFKSSLASYNVAVYRHNYYGISDGWYAAGTGLGVGSYDDCNGNWLYKPQYAYALSCFYATNLGKVLIGGGFMTINTTTTCPYTDSWGCAGNSYIGVAQLTGTTLARLGSWRTYSPAAYRIAGHGTNVFFQGIQGATTICDPTNDPVGDPNVWRYVNNSWNYINFGSESAYASDISASALGLFIVTYSTAYRWTP